MIMMFRIALWRALISEILVFTVQGANSNATMIADLVHVFLNTVSYYCSYSPQKSQRKLLFCICPDCISDFIGLINWTLNTGAFSPIFYQSYRHRFRYITKSLIKNSGLCFNNASYKILYSHYTAIHQLLAEHTIQEAQNLQITLGKLRYASQHYQNQVIALDPHRMISHSKRIMPKRSGNPRKSPEKSQQLFFALDAYTYQPIAFTIGSSSLSATQGTHDLMQLITAILPSGALILADTEHFTIALLNEIGQTKDFDLLVPASQQPYRIKKIKQIPESQFQRHWAGYATACIPYQPKGSKVPLYLFVQRNGERPQEYFYNSFVATNNSERVHQLTAQFPKRWHVEEFFNLEQELGWRRSGTLNLNIRYARASFALVAQAALYQLRDRLGIPFDQYTAEHFSQDLFQRLDGDLRVDKDTIIVTYYNAPNAEPLKYHYENLPEKLQKKGVDPRVPWLYNFKLDFRFR